MGTPNFPAWITAPGGQYLVVDSQAEKDAVMSGRAIITEVASAQGSTFVIEVLPPKPAPQGISMRAQEKADSKADDLVDERAEDREEAKAQAKRKR